eukprot:6615948-Prymnesium_polylepis.1
MSCLQNWVEHSKCFRCFGRVGCGSFGDRRRTPIMCSAFVASLVAWIMMICSGLAVAENENMITKFGWAKATLDGPYQTLNLDLGIKAITAELYNKSTGNTTTSTIAWRDDVCGDAISAEMATACNSCEEQLSSSVIFIFLSVLTQFPQLT